MTYDKALVRFSATHGVLSRYMVLPWEDGEEYGAVLAAFREEHAPQGPTEEHLVEEVTGIVWRKRRLRLAGAAAHREALYDTIDTYSKTARVALAHLHKAKPQKVWKMSELGQSRRSESVSMTSGLPR